MPYYTFAAMETMEILGWASALIIGISLGLIGGGGSILTVPVMAYLFFLDSVSATAYSLFIVGTASLVGAFSYMKKNLISYKTVLVFGLPAIAAVYLVRKYLVPALPELIIGDGTGFTVTKNMFIMGIFALLMLAASYSMIRQKETIKDVEKYRPQVFNYPMIFLEGMLVGGLTGLVGAGGGFLIIPALVVLSKLPIKLAVGTSLLIISIKSLVGFTGDLSNDALNIDWTFLLSFTGVTIVGIILGSYLSNYVPSKKLRPAFGYFVVVMGVYILVKEFVM